MPDLLLAPVIFFGAALVEAALVENVSRPDQRILAATLATLPGAAARLAGPAVTHYGLAPGLAAQTIPHLQEASA